jgi:hypothetical protein
VKPAAKNILRLVVLGLGFAPGLLAALAHPLPGSTLTFAAEADKLELTITIPVPELKLARSTLSQLGNLPDNSNLTAAQNKDLAAYLREHLTLTPADRPALDLQMISARVQDARHEDVGQYDLLVVEMAAPLQAGQNFFPAVLTYDAVLHEVRNHHASVWLAKQGSAAVHLGDIRFDATLGTSFPLELSGNR